ncbi:Phytosulfokine [Sesbania bispinosa]|nr:Phytosulfokine [Sesbania bispinosa]
MKMSSKVSATFCLVVFFFLFLTLTSAARRGPASSSFISSSKTQHGVLEEEKVDVEENCEGINEEECLMRRTLVAHTDYIYTQKRKP